MWSTLPLTQLAGAGQVAVRTSQYMAYKELTDKEPFILKIFANTFS